MRHQRIVVRLAVFALALLCSKWTIAAEPAEGDGSAAASQPATVKPPVDAAALLPAPSPAADFHADDVHDDMRVVLHKVGSLPCSEHVRSRLFLLLYENNRALHDQCLSDCKYQFFPATKDKATPEQIVAAATSKACVTLFSGVILANFPECDIDFVSARSCAEILLRIKKDIDDKDVVPSQAQFYQFYNLNRVINLLNENASLIEDAFRNTTTHISLWEMTKMMNRIYVSPDVMLADDMTILVRDNAAAATTIRPNWKQANIALTLGDTTSKKSTAAVAVGSSAGSRGDQGDTSSSSFTPTASASAAPIATLEPAPAAINETVQSSQAALHAVWSSAVAVAVAVVVGLCV